MALGAATGKLIAVITNVVFLGVSLFLIVVGSVILNSANSSLVSGGTILAFFPIDKIGGAFLAMGLVLLVITAAGVFGVLRKSKRLLCIYLPAVFLIVMSQAVFTLILLAFGYNLVDATMQDAWKTNTDQDKQFQTSFNCCGYASTDTAVLPCPTNYQGTCKDAAIRWISANVRPLIIAVAVIVSLEIVAWISVCYVRSNVKDNEFEDKWVH
eukprot:TRINITY_DN54_c0_g2_i2.p1 TRINITY_DN54_c0_g2~~TRINITY_DN54_c0_g2_i2.p1  ORF type:complete len:231 (+),score=50.30 TRINITY_DN54_c0_g2_i2:58-693(+)